MKTAKFVTLFLLCFSCIYAQNLDRNDPKSTAQLILKAYQAKNLEELLTYCNKTNKRIISQIAVKGEKHPRYRSIFKGWRWQAIQKWDGKIGPVKYINQKIAKVQFGKIRKNYVSVVTLVKEKGQWCFEDIHNFPLNKYPSLLKALNKDNEEIFKQNKAPRKLSLQQTIEQMIHLLENNKHADVIKIYVFTEDLKKLSKRMSLTKLIKEFENSSHSKRLLNYLKVIQKMKPEITNNKAVFMKDAKEWGKKKPFKNLIFKKIKTNWYLCN